MKINFPKSIFANFTTSLNLFSGFLSIVYSGNEDFYYASLFIFSAAFFDLFDGLIARLTKTSSKFGVELDSLGDVVSFGAAPSYLLYKTYFHNFGIWGLIISSFILIFGAFRLARFNIQLDDITQKHDFTGLPIPFSAVAIASIVLFYFNGITFSEMIAKLLIPIVLLLSYLMVSSIRYNAWPKINKMSLSGKIIVITFSLIAVLLIFFTAGKAFLYFIAINILFGIARHTFYGISLLKNSQLKLKAKIN